MRGLRGALGGLTLVACLGTSLAVASPASAEQVEAVVRAGPLGLTTYPATLPDHALDGANRGKRSSTAGEWIAQNARGTPTGWSVSLAASGDFISAGGTVETTARAISISNLVIDPGAVNAKPESDPTTNISTSLVTVSTSAQSFLVCSSGCKGRYGFTPEFTLTVPANAYRSNYSGAVGGSALNPYTITLTFTIA